MEYIVIVALPILIGAVIYYFYKQYTGKSYAQKTSNIADSAQGLLSMGFTRDANGYRGSYRGFYINIYTTASSSGNYQNLANTSMSGPKFQVWASVAPKEGQLKQLGGFLGKYLVNQGQPGYAMIGFLVNHNAGSDQTGEILNRLNQLLNALNENGVMPYVA
jgi:hypothetical protein